MPADPRYHDCPQAGCNGKASMPARDGQGRPVWKCTRCSKLATDDQLRRASLARTPRPDDD